MTDHPERGTAVPSLMREPEECLKCGRFHLTTEPCVVMAKCVQCGRGIGYVYETELGHAECRVCIREGLE